MRKITASSHTCPECFLRLSTQFASRKNQHEYKCIHGAGMNRSISEPFQSIWGSAATNRREWKSFSILIHFGWLSLERSGPGLYKIHSRDEWIGVLVLLRFFLIFGLKQGQTQSFYVTMEENICNGSHSYLYAGRQPCCGLQGKKKSVCLGWFVRRVFFDRLNITFYAKVCGHVTITTTYGSFSKGWWTQTWTRCRMPMPLWH